MNYIQIMGGLGNQLFQYSFAKYIEYKTGKPLTFYTGSYDMNTDGTDMTKREFFLDHYNTIYNLAEDKIHFNRMINDDNINYTHDMDNVFYNGYWQDKRFVIENKEDLLKDLELKENFITNEMRAIAHEMKSCESIAIHVRRMDYLNAYNKDIYYELSLEYYISAIQIISDRSEHAPVLYIFSDDFDYINTYMNNFCGLKTILIKADSAYKDLYLMSQAKHHIIANSTFSWWGAVLSEHNKGITIAPKHWYKDRKNPDLYLSEWMIIDNFVKSDKISVIVPAYNVEKYVDRCLKSIEEQTYDIKNLEVILVNDASTDNTLTHLKAFESKYPENVLLIDLGKNGGLGAARNVGLRYVTGKYITYVDSDDFIDISMLYKMYAKAKDFDCDVVECGYKKFSDESDAYITNDIEQSFYLDLKDNSADRIKLFNSGKSSVWSRLYKTSFITDNALLFEENILYEDVPYTGQCFFLINSYYRINETLYYYFYNPAGISYSEYRPERMHQETEVVERLLISLYKRDLLNRILSDKSGNLLYVYVTTKVFIDPLTMVLNSSLKFGDILNEINYFKNFLLDIFPDITDHWLISNDQEICRFALYLLKVQNSAAEDLFRDTAEKRLIVFYDSAVSDMIKVHSTLDQIVDMKCNNHIILDIDKTLYNNEHLLLRHAINREDTIVIQANELYDNRSQALSFAYIQKILEEYRENRAVLLLNNLYYDETDECAGTLSSLVEALNKHTGLSLILFDTVSYELLRSIMPLIDITLITPEDSGEKHDN